MPSYGACAALSFALSLGAIAAASGARASEDVAGPDPIRCYPGERRSGLREEICESRRIVTVETVRNRRPSGRPSETILRLHADGPPPAFDGTVRADAAAAPGTSPSLPAPSPPAGFSLALAGGVSASGRGPLGAFRYGVAWDAAPALDLPLTIGFGIDRTETIGATSTWPGGVTAASLRLGYAADDRLVLRISGGVSLPDPHRGITGPSRVRTGWHAGLGLSYRLDEAWSLTLDYRYTRLNVRRSFGSPGRRPHAEESSLLAGLSYRFGGP